MLITKKQLLAEIEALHDKQRKNEEAIRGLTDKNRALGKSLKRMQKSADLFYDDTETRLSRLEAYRKKNAGYLIHVDEDEDAGPTYAFVQPYDFFKNLEEANDEDA